MHRIRGLVFGSANRPFLLRFQFLAIRATHCRYEPFAPRLIEDPGQARAHFGQLLADAGERSISMLRRDFEAAFALFVSR
jgi:hypothetical protein